MRALLACGDRWWPSPSSVARVIEGSQFDTLIHGDARGADKLSGAVAERMIRSVEVFPALWDTYGLRAGRVRNEAMLDRLLQFRSIGWDVGVIAFHNDLAGSSKGTKHMVQIAKRRDVAVKLVKQKPVVLSLRSHPDYRLDGELPYARVDRKTHWGNPFTHLPGRTAAKWVVGSRGEAVARYREQAWANEELIAAARAELRGRNLACWCTPKECHASVLLEIANS